jgi:adenine-specific DNA-methyltransferase
MINDFLIGNNLSLLSKLDDKSCGLVYMDPPYNTGRDFGEFEDKFKSMEEYSQSFLMPRFKQIHRVLKNSGNIVVHVEPKNSHYVRFALDEVFGIKNFRNEIAWKTGGNAKNKKQLGRHHDTIFVYSKSNSFTFNPLYLPYDEEYKKKASAKQCEETGRWYVTTALHNSQPEVNPRHNLRYEWNGHKKQWYCTIERMKFLHDDNRLQYNKKGIPRIKRFLDEMDGIPVRDLWLDINQIQGNEKLPYPTQKPVELLKRIIKLYSNERDLVLDPFAGSGTTGRAAIQLNRDWLLFDINPKGKEIFFNSLGENK